MTAIEERLSRIRFIVDDESHIIVDSTRCEICPHHNCKFCCPAECFRLEVGSVSFSYHGCMECGACMIACDQGAVKWSHPRGGFGVSFCLG